MDQRSVSDWLAAVKEGDEAAYTQLWRRFSPDLLRIARLRLDPNVRRTSDEEDVALSAFVAFWRGVTEGRFSLLRDRDGLRRLLVTLVRQKAADHTRTDNRKKRDSKRTQSDSAFRAGNAVPPVDRRNAMLDAPPPDLLLMLHDEVNHFVGALKEKKLRTIAMRRLAGATNPEIAAALDVSVRTIDRKVKLIKAHWEALAEC